MTFIYLTSLEMHKSMIHNLPTKITNFKTPSPFPFSVQKYWMTIIPVLLQSMSCHKGNSSKTSNTQKSHRVNSRQKWAEVAGKADGHGDLTVCGRSGCTVLTELVQVDTESPQSSAIWNAHKNWNNRQFIEIVSRSYYTIHL